MQVQRGGGSGVQAYCEQTTNGRVQGGGGSGVQGHYAHTFMGVQGGTLHLKFWAVYLGSVYLRLRPWAPEMQSETARTLRGGKWVHDFPARELVPGDLIELRTGDRNPADARLFKLKTATLRVVGLGGYCSPRRRERDASAWLRRHQASALAPVYEEAPGSPRHRVAFDSIYEGSKFVG